ncbi:triose-phosphate isomerase [Propionimicrobium lymphophilum]|uniref:Triosephosphate isomerase n=1 Tax=Propionimicrobium lymphophilum ACS-093-V-SCH5 TaxID=883161 RepID=S2W544_9ACTN|nr:MULTISPECIES: triose-phosphate isomerase [Propionimicrobium]EPD33385.1 triose-phosphate isomerase [Propionimicrobium lymphophilum ACS-093-V-SCH5]ETJ98113.1 triose-phosphate isomerase [Propionimicrobium sp. BV2F7]MDK7709766.1 triose-phosphate isomerase [Propionimicrobium lymphophilum]MDK7733972.1 triose-phosphate isomerase [Propionimicrobium lymphophilum]
MARKPIMAGNWKMNLTHVDGLGLVQKLAWTLEDKKWDADKVEAVVIPPFTSIHTVQTLVNGDRLKLGYGAQDVSAHDDGAYTGEVSADMLAKLGCGYVVVGHSERREYHNETDEIVNAKAKKAIEKGITPIICVGEGLDVREAGNHVAFVTEQVEGSLAGIPADDVAKLVIAYEPVWAIGTGKTASAEDAQEVCAAVRAKVAELYDEATADSVRIQYGGSVKPENVSDIMAQPDVDGALVGGASLDPEKFADIVLF